MKYADKEIFKLAEVLGVDIHWNKNVIRVYLPLSIDKKGHIKKIDHKSCYSEKDVMRVIKRWLYLAEEVCDVLMYHIKEKHPEVIILITKKIVRIYPVSKKCFLMLMLDRILKGPLGQGKDFRKAIIDVFINDIRGR